MHAFTTLLLVAAGAFAAPAPVPQTYNECELVLTTIPATTCPLQPANGSIGEYCDAIGKSFRNWSWGDYEDQPQDCYAVCCYISS
ncbi:hypothetical protein SLS58_007812 [Diplodia intermedia]|uniref:Uncharacterized protein n=1 Tax=Diplodia intermedia TaxID=856260 RepID=A0ABR3TJA7_9PEZI